MERIEYKGYFIDKTEHGWRICKEDNTDIHTHLRNLVPSYKLIDNVVLKKIPKICGNYYLESHARLSTDEKYIQKVTELLEVRKNKTRQFYYNPHKKSF